MSPLDHDHPVDAERVAAARDGVLSPAEAGRLAGLVSFRKDGRMVFYRLSNGFPRQLLEHCLPQLLSLPRRRQNDDDSA